MTPKRNEGFTQKEAAAFIGCSVRTFRRDRERYGIEPKNFTGITPVFTKSQVKAMEKARIESIKQRRATR